MYPNLSKPPNCIIFSSITQLHTHSNTELPAQIERTWKKPPRPLMNTSIQKCNSNIIKRVVISLTCLSWPRRFDKRTIWSLRVFHALASKHSWRMSVTAFLVPATSPASLICFSTFNSASISASKLRWASWKFKEVKAENDDSEVHRDEPF